MLSLSQLLSSNSGLRIDIGVYIGNSQSHIDPNLRVTSPVQSSAVGKWVDLYASKQPPISIHQPIINPLSQRVDEQESGKDT